MKRESEFGSPFRNQNSGWREYKDQENRKRLTKYFDNWFQQEKS